MRHGKRFNHLSRTSAHRKAMLANMASSLIIHKRIKTTVAKAKALRTYIEPLITKSKTDSTHSRRVVFSYLNDKEAVTELFREISVKIADRPGGYTRIIKIGARMGDNAEMALIELVDYNENLLDAKAKGPKKTRRRRGGAKKEAGEAIGAEQAVETTDEVVEDVADEESTSAEAIVDEPADAKAMVDEPADAKAMADEPADAKAMADKEEPKAEEKEEPKAETKEEPASAEATADDDEPKAEEAKEEPKAEEVKEEPKAEEVKEESKAEEVKEEPKAEEVKEEPKAETKEESTDAKATTDDDEPKAEEKPEDEENKDKKE